MAFFSLLHYQDKRMSFVDINMVISWAVVIAGLGYDYFDKRESYSDREACTAYGYWSVSFILLAASCLHHNFALGRKDTAALCSDMSAKSALQYRNFFRRLKPNYKRLGATEAINLSACVFGLAGLGYHFFTEGNYRDTKAIISYAYFCLAFLIVLASSLYHNCSLGIENGAGLVTYTGTARRDSTDSQKTLL